MGLCTCSIHVPWTHVSFFVKVFSLFCFVTIHFDLNFTFICLIQSGATCRRITTRFPETRTSSFGLLTSWYKSKRYQNRLHKYQCFIFKRLRCFCCRSNITHSRWCHHFHWWLIPARVFVAPRCRSDLQDATSIMFAQLCRRSSKPTVTLPSFDILLLPIFFSHLFRLVLFHTLCWNSRSSRRQRKSGCRLLPAGATLLYPIDFWLAISLISPGSDVHLLTSLFIS